MLQICTNCTVCYSCFCFYILNFFFFFKYIYMLQPAAGKLEDITGYFYPLTCDGAVNLGAIF